MNYAINRVQIAKALFGTYGVPKWGFVTADPKADSSDFHYDYDVAKAKQLLAEAGYAKGFSLSLICSGYFGSFGEPLMNAVAPESEGGRHSRQYPVLPRPGRSVRGLRLQVQGGGYPDPGPVRRSHRRPTRCTWQRRPRLPSLRRR